MGKPRWTPSIKVHITCCLPLNHNTAATSPHSFSAGCWSSPSQALHHPWGNLFIHADTLLTVSIFPQLTSLLVARGSQPACSPSWLTGHTSDLQPFCPCPPSSAPATLLCPFLGRRQQNSKAFLVFPSAEGDPDKTCNF